MTLSSDNGKQFFELMWGLQYFIGQKLGLLKNISSLAMYADLRTEKKLKVRDALWEHPELIEAFVQKNPQGLPAEALEIVHKWKGFIKGSFFIFRHLKKDSIFIGKDDKVYAVHGIQDPLDEVIPSYTLPQMVEAVLLPFKGQIIYDGLLSGYGVHFGGSIRTDLNHVYMVAKQMDCIIFTLETDPVAPAPAKPKKNILPQLQEINTNVAKVKGGGPLQTSALALARASLELAIADADGSNELDAQAHKLRRAVTSLFNHLEIMEEE